MIESRHRYLIYAVKYLYISEFALKINAHISRTRPIFGGVSYEDIWEIQSD